MNFTGTRKSTLAELALTHLYTEATRNNEDPSDDTELAYHTLEEALEELGKLKSLVYDFLNMISLNYPHGEVEKVLDKLKEAVKDNE